jgi:ribosomal protein L37E
MSNENNIKPDAVEVKPLKGKKKEKVVPSYVCRGCGESNYEVHERLEPIDYHGFLDDGKRYTAILRTRVRCRGCGQSGLITAHEYDPSAWKE